MKQGIPGPSLKRLPIYYRRLMHAVDADVPYVSSSELGKSAGVPPTQVRKDLSYLEEQGRSGVGYDAKGLAAHLEDYLGLVNDKEAVLVGVGNLGRALALYPGFKNYGLRIVVLFDNDPQLIGKKIGDLSILSVEKLEDLVRRMQTRIGILTVPAQAAQKIAEAMVAGGVKAIWNFSPVRLELPDEILVKNEDLASEMALLSHYIQKYKTNHQ